MIGGTVVERSATYEIKKVVRVERKQIILSE
jgi:hypothetical protein